MDASLEKLKAKIEKLKAQQQQIEAQYIDAVAHLVEDLTHKGLDLPILTGIILNARDIVTKLPANKEAWQTDGQKFLVRAKHQNTSRKKSHANH